MSSTSKAPPDYVGSMRKGDVKGTVVATIRDKWNWPIEITGWLDKSTGEYVLEGWLGPTPAVLRVEGMDDAETGERH